jgi:transcriptional regulator with XRE-family HTH domain|tara:strand:+ start:15959 stop:16282 length:324 start_codon:yes stop_codon:yes gene_type:complete
MNDIVSRILEIMKKKNISASDLSKKINVQKSNISHILSRRNKPSLDFIIKLSNAFNDLNAEWLINGSQTSTPSNALSLQKKNENSKKKVNKIILFYEDNSFETYENF